MLNIARYSEFPKHLIFQNGKSLLHNIFFKYKEIKIIINIKFNFFNRTINKLLKKD